jgi:hypothetical protein
MDLDFSPSPRLALALHRPPEDGRPLYELVVPHRPIFEDVGSAPPEAEFLATRGTAANLARIAELDNLTALWANPASPTLFRACALAPRLRALYVVHFKQLAEVPLEGAPALEHLLLSWAPRLANLSFLEELPALRTLYLEDMKRIDLGTLPELPNLLGLHLGGGMWSTLKVESLAPLVRLPRLRYLQLSNVRPQDGSLRPLAKLVALRKLYLPNFFSVEEFARLAAALPHTEGNARTPFFTPIETDLPRSDPFICPQCGASRQMMAGRPAVVLCPNCDAPKMRRRVARWEAARGTVWPSSA